MDLLPYVMVGLFGAMLGGSLMMLWCGGQMSRVRREAEKNSWRAARRFYEGRRGL